MFNNAFTKKYFSPGNTVPNSVSYDHTQMSIDKHCGISLCIFHTSMWFNVFRNYNHIRDARKSFHYYQI